MGKRQKKTEAVWTVFLKGNALALGVYLVGILLAALLLVKGVLPESAAFPVIGALCVLAALGGGVVVARGTTWGTLPAALLNTVIFAALLALVGMACWPEGISWGGRGGVLLLCALAGGVVAGLVGRRRGQRKKRK